MMGHERKVVWYNCTKTHIRLMKPDPQGDIIAGMKKKVSRTISLPVEQSLFFIYKYDSSVLQSKLEDGIKVIQHNPIVDLSINTTELPGLNSTSQRRRANTPDVVYVIMEKEHAEYIKNRWKETTLNVFSRATKTLVVTVDGNPLIQMDGVGRETNELGSNYWKLYDRVHHVCEFNFISKNYF